ncbi:histone-lysine N-methyltransferase set-1-like [Carassius carassius]|uniref:histone-lysine N-methyltransferase set-1-like n=1 Tax=Carassius carassius TaxID=217509 RepID=UPI0028696EE0|nr:histone-lysine N-methyltransferase set-1-like [Carassius carassius]
MSSRAGSSLILKGGVCSAVLTLRKEISCWNTEETSSAKKNVSGGHALQVFMFEFGYNGKLLCVDAARGDGSLGRLVNDDHINPNSRIKTIRVDGKPHLCLFATRSICPGEEIPYDYGDSDWPWRCTTFL